MVGRQKVFSRAFVARRCDLTYAQAANTGA